MIDLHIHSTYSDGTDSVKTILEKAKKLNLSTISITDHEKCDAYEELERTDVKKHYSGNIITGIELKTWYKTGIIDVLGYNFDYKKMKQMLEKCIKREYIEESVLDILYEYAKKYDLILKPKQELIWDKSKDWAVLVFYDEMKSHIKNKEKVPKDIWESFFSFKRNYLTAKGKDFYVDLSKYYPTIKEVTEMIHNANGIAAIAHIHEYEWMKEKLIELKELIKYVDAVECYHGTFTDEEIKHLKAFCKESGVLMSGGSDYHGKMKPDIKLGVGKGNLSIPEDIIDDWEIKARRRK